MNQVWEWIVGGVGHLLSGLKDMAAGIVGKILATFGLTMVSFNAILPNLKAFVVDRISGLPPHVTEFLGAIGLGIAMSMILSALTVRMAWKVFIVPKSIADTLQGGGTP